MSTMLTFGAHFAGSEGPQSTLCAGPGDEDARQQHAAPAAMRRTFGGGWVAEDEEDECDPLVELWVGNLCAGATRLSIRRAFECFGEVASVQLQAAPGEHDLQFAFVELPASSAELAIEELDGRMIYELSGDQMLLKVKQSKRSVKPLLKWQQQQQQHKQQHYKQQQRAEGAWQPSASAALQVDCGGGGSTALLQGTVREVKKFLLCDGPPSRTLWLGNVAGTASPTSLQALFGRYGIVMRARLFTAPGHNNPYFFGFVDMRNAEDAETAQEELQGAVHIADLCDSKPLKIRYAWPKHLARPASAGSMAAMARSDESSGLRVQLHTNGGSHAAVVQHHTVAAATQEQAAAATAGSSGSSPAEEAASANPAQPLCASCGTDSSSAALKRCSGCHSVLYCSRECQLRHWEVQHVHDCQRVAQLERLFNKQPQGPSAQQNVVSLLASALQQPGGRQAQLVQALLQQQAGVAAGSNSVPT